MVHHYIETTFQSGGQATGAGGDNLIQFTRVKTGARISMIVPTHGNYDDTKKELTNGEVRMLSKQVAELLNNFFHLQEPGEAHAATTRKRSRSPKPPK